MTPSPKFLLPVIAVLSFAGSALAEELIITLRNGKTIVLDTAEIRSMEFTKSGETIRLLPSPHRIREGNRPPGLVTASFRPTRRPGGNVGLSVSFEGTLPNQAYDVYVWVDGRLHSRQPVLHTQTDRGGYSQSSAVLNLPPGDRLLGLSIAAHNSEADLYISPGLYEKGGTSLRVPR